MVLQESSFLALSVDLATCLHKVKIHGGKHALTFKCKAEWGFPKKTHSMRGRKPEPDCF